jgi:hypothetical protein
MSGGLGGHQWIYRGLLRSYPAEYRESFGDQMVQLFADQVRDEGAGRAWLRALRDLPPTAVSEHLRRDRSMAHSMSMAPSPASRILGLLGILGGAGLLVAFVIQIPADTNYIRLFVFGLGGIAVVVAVHLRQLSVAPLLSLAAAVPALLCATWLFVMEVLLTGRQPPVFGGTFGWVFFSASLAAWLAYAWFGLVSLYLRQVTRIGSAALAVGSLLGVLGIDRLGLVSPSEQSVFSLLALAGVFLHGLGLIMLGVDVARRRRAAPTASAS